MFDITTKALVNLIENAERLRWGPTGGPYTLAAAVDEWREVGGSVEQLTRLLRIADAVLNEPVWAIRRPELHDEAERIELHNAIFARLRAAGEATT